MIVYCVNKGNIKNLTLNKQYVVTRVQSGTHFGSDRPYSGIWVINDSGKEHHYSSKRFLEKDKHREMLLNDLGI